MKNASGVAVRLIGLNYDVTEQVEAEERLRTTTKAIDAATYGVVITSAQNDREITYVNPAFEGITGYTSEEVIGKNCRILSKGTEHSPEITILKNALEAWKPVTVTLRNARKDDAPVLEPIERVSNYK